MSSTRSHRAHHPTRPTRYPAFHRVSHIPTEQCGTDRRAAGWATASRSVDRCGSTYRWQCGSELEPARNGLAKTEGLKLHCELCSDMSTRSSLMDKPLLSPTRTIGNHRDRLVSQSFEVIQWHLCQNGGNVTKDYTALLNSIDFQQHNDSTTSVPKQRRGVSV